mgnify:CR=1 FL=1
MKEALVNISRTCGYFLQRVAIAFESNCSEQIDVSNAPEFKAFRHNGGLFVPRNGQDSWEYGDVFFSRQNLI